MSREQWHFYEDTGKLVKHTATPKYTPLVKTHRFYIKDLIVSPSQIEAGNKVTITVTVGNMGSEEDDYSLEIAIDGKTQVEKTMTISPGSTETVRYAVTIYETGNHTITVGTITENVYVSASSVK